MTHRIYSTPVAVVYDLYEKKVIRKGRSLHDLQLACCWLLQVTPSGLTDILDSNLTFREMFDRVTVNPAAELITGKICGVTIQDIEDPLMKKIRYLDKVVDEVAQGKSMEKICRRVLV